MSKDKCMDGVEAWDCAVKNSIYCELTKQILFVPLDIVFEIINCMQNQRKKEIQSTIDKLREGTKNES